MTSYRSKAATWGLNDEVKSTHFETVEDNADTALQVLDARVPKYLTGDPFGATGAVIHTIGSAATVRITESGSTIELSYGSATTGDILTAMACFPVQIGDSSSKFALKIVASGGTTSTVHAVGLPSTCKSIVSMVGSHVVVTADNKLRHYACLYMTKDGASGTTVVYGGVGINGSVWRAVS
jgi:hypothetical protein